METWTIDTFESEKVKLKLSLVSNEHYMMKNNRQDTKVFYNLCMDKFTTQDYHKGDEWINEWYNEDFTSFAAAYNTFEMFKELK